MFLSISHCIKKLTHRLPHRLYFGKNERQIPSAITILQPFVEAILRGLKGVENRKRPFFKLHANKSLYQHPTAPKQTQCRFCPPDLSKDGTVKPCVYWAHAKETSSRNRRASKPPLTPISTQSDDTEEDSDGDETSAYYSSDENGKIEYVTRSKLKSLHVTTDNNENGVVSKNIKKNNRKRKRSQIEKENETKMDTPTPPQKKSKKSSKKRKKKKKKKKKKKYDREKWIEPKDYLIGEEGVVPVRMCWHGQHMHPEKNPDVPKECALCDEDIGFDHYYCCRCSGEPMNYCYDHTQPVKIKASDSWKNVLCDYDDGERKDIIESMHKMMKRIKKQNKHRVIGEEQASLQPFQAPLVDPDALNKINMDFMRERPMPNIKIQVPLFTVEANPESVADSIDAVLSKKQMEQSYFPMDLSQIPPIHSMFVSVHLHE